MFVSEYCFRDTNRVFRITLPDIFHIDKVTDKIQFVLLTLLVSVTQLKTAPTSKIQLKWRRLNKEDHESSKPKYVQIQ